MRNFIAGELGKVYLANGKPLSIIGKGDVCIQSTNSYRWTLKDVRYISDLRKMAFLLDNWIVKVAEWREFVENCEERTDSGSRLQDGHSVDYQ